LFPPVFFFAPAVKLCVLENALSMFQTYGVGDFPQVVVVGDMVFKLPARLKRYRVYNKRVTPKGVDELIIEQERSELLHRIIADLPEIQRRRFLLYYEYDFNYYEIAAMEHCTAQAVRRSVVLAREKIRAQMKKYLCP
jgi:hypothetical protein